MHNKLAEITSQNTNLIQKDMYEAIRSTYKDHRQPELLQEYFRNRRPTGFCFIKYVVNQIIKDENVEMNA